MVEKKSPLRKVLIYVALTVIVLLTLMPLLWMLSASLKANNEVFTIPLKWIPENPRWSNYSVIWERINLALYTFNSFKLSIIITLIQVLTSSFAAYGFAKLRIRGKEVYFWLLLAALTLPEVVLVVPLFVTANALSLYDTLWAVLLPLAALQTPFAILLARNFYKTCIYYLSLIDK